MKLKIEINTREHYHFSPLINKPFSCISRWFTDNVGITTFCIEEIMATKLRALYQRKKGRDLFDFWVIKNVEINSELTVEIFKKYMNEGKNSVSKKQYTKNLEDKMNNKIFLYDIEPIINPNINYDPNEAFEYVMDEYINKI